MEKKIIQLLDYQKFEKNDKIEKMLSELEGKYETDLLDDEALSFAVGGVKQEDVKKENEK